MTSNTAHKAISIRCATNANDTASATIARSIKAPAPARPSLLSWRTKFTVAAKASAWTKIVHATAPANHQWIQDRELMILRHLSTTSIPSHHTDHDALDLRRITFGPPSPAQP